MRFANVLACTMAMTAVFCGFMSSALAADVLCTFKAEDDQVDVAILIGETTIWSGTLMQNGTKTLTIPQGAFTVMSQIYNPNLNRKEEIRSTSHTNMCKENQALPLPLFSPTK
ncbi:MAG: hypothetical protein C4293_09525 [Nitrospiraceae bacterium]